MENVRSLCIPINAYVTQRHVNYGNKDARKIIEMADEKNRPDLRTVGQAGPFFIPLRLDV